MLKYEIQNEIFMRGASTLFLSRCWFVVVFFKRAGIEVIGAMCFTHCGFNYDRIIQKVQLLGMVSKTAPRFAEAL